MEVEGAENLSVYHAKLYDREDPNGEVPASEAERNFYKLCGRALWLYSPSWPDLWYTPCLRDRHTLAQTARARQTAARFRCFMGRGSRRRAREELRAFP